MKKGQITLIVVCLTLVASGIVIFMNMKKYVESATDIADTDLFCRYHGHGTDEQ